jgi:germination protein M
VPRPRIQAGMRSRAFAVSLALAALAAGCGSEEEGSSDPAAKSTTPPTVESQPQATVPETAPAILKVYFLRKGKVEVAAHAVVAGPAVARAALVELLEGPTQAERARGLTTGVPADTKLEDLSIESGAAHVQLSQSLDEAAIAQVVYTLTQFPTVRRVRLEGEEHARGDFEAETPAILVESPVPGEEVSSPLRIEGTANTFEATFHVEVLDARRRVVGESFVTATSGSGERGTFDAHVSFAAIPGPAVLRVFELSAEDGSRMNELEIPLQIAP